MKKAVVGMFLVLAALRFAMFAGAGEVIAAWVSGLEENGAFSVRIPESLPPGESAEPEEEDRIVFVAVTPEPSPELGSNLGEELPPQILSTTISADVSIRNDTGFEIDLEELAAEGLELRLDGEGPQILIIHTHGSEAYTRDSIDNYEESDPYRTEDKRYNVIRVGDRLAEKLEEYGLRVLHDREIYDYPSYTGSYSRSGAAVESYLKQYPDIKIVIDLHRDALGSGDTVYKTEAAVEGKSSSQVMLLVGTGENGLYHPNWRENLKLALCLQSAMDRAYPSLARPLALKSERYNQHLCTGSLILEVGSTGNTLSEALCAIELFAAAAGPALAELAE